MRTLVVHESMYGNTRRVAEAVAEGIAAGDPGGVVTLVPVARVRDTEDAMDADLLVVGAPTHVWGLSRVSTRRSAAEAAGRPGSRLTLEPDAQAAGVREWLAGTGDLPRLGAAFDTRMGSPLGLGGSAARRIAERFRRRDVRAVVRPHSSRVTKQNTLVAGELERARDWGRTVALAGAALSRTSRA